MKLKLYVIHDKVAEDSTPPMAISNDSMARRVFKKSMKENENVFDYNLYCVGLFNTTSMEVTPQAPELIETNDEKLSIQEYLDSRTSTQRELQDGQAFQI